MSDLAPGFVLGRYRVESLLGRGGMGDVYRAEDTLLKRRVALKILRPDTSPSSGADENRRRLLREARAAAAFEHPNVVTIYDVGEQSGVAFIAMQLVEGVPLRMFIGRPDVAVAQRVAWLAGVARALAAAHRAGLVHRDIKPDNVMVCDGGVKVLDFGIAKRAPAAQPHSVIYSTQPGQWVGTPRYMAPEQRLGQADPRSDQYAWAVVAHELLGGRLPDVPGMPIDPLPPAADVPPAVRALLQRALLEDPAHRFATMDEVVAALASFDGPTFAPPVVTPGMHAPAAPPQPTPLSAYSTVPSQASPRAGYAPSYPPAAPLGPPVSIRHSGAVPAGSPTLASSRPKSGAGLGLALALAGIGLVVLGGVGAIAVYLVVLRDGASAAAPSASTSASGNANASGGTNATTLGPTATATATATPTATSTSTGGGRRLAVDAGAAAASRDAGLTPTIADAGAPPAPNVADAAAPKNRFVFVSGNSPSYPMSDTMARARALQPALSRCVLSQLPDDSPLTGISTTTYIRSWDGGVDRVTVTGNDAVPEGVRSCIEATLRGQVYPKPNGAGLVLFTLSIRQ